MKLHHHILSILLILILSIKVGSSQTTYQLIELEDNINLHVGDKIIIPTCYIGGSTIDEMAENKIKCEAKAMINLLIDFPNVKIEIGSHTDCRMESTSDETTEILANKYKNYVILSGIEPDRIVAKGYGSSEPCLIDSVISNRYPFLKNTEKLDCDFINNLKSIEEQEVAHELNRRTELTIMENREDSNCYKILDNWCFTVNGKDRKKSLCIINNDEDLKSHWNYVDCEDIIDVDFDKFFLVGFMHNIGIAERTILRVNEHLGLGLFYDIIQPISSHSRVAQYLQKWYLVEYNISDISFSVIVKRKDKYWKYIIEDGKIKEIFE